MSGVLTPIPPHTTGQKRVMGFDIETHGRKNTFLCATFVDVKNVTVCYSPDEIITFLDTFPKIEEYDVVATNLAFDFFGSFIEHAHRFSMLERNGKLYQCMFYKNNNPKLGVRFLDTTNYFPASVEKLGKLVGIKKLAHPSCFGRKPQNQQEWNELVEYCANDSRISRQYMVEFVHKDCDRWKIKNQITNTGNALRLYRAQFLHKIYKPHDHKTNQFIFGAYYGGRTECFRRGIAKNVQCWDINSLYPWALCKKYPDPNSVQEVKRPNIDYIRLYEGVSTVKIRMPTMHIPPLPHRAMGRLLFPVGEWVASYTHVELRYALKCGATILDISEQLIYRETEKPYKKFIDTLYAYRREQQTIGDPLEIQTKLKMNGFYGRLGFRYMESSSIISYTQLTDDVRTRATQIIPLGEYYSIRQDDNDDVPYYSFPIIAAYCTSYARIRLHEELTKHQTDVYYCDTDSLFLPQECQVESSTRLGEFKREGGVCPEALFVRPKFYAAEKIKLKGVAEVKTRDDFVALIDGLSAKRQRFTKLRSALKSLPSHKYGVRGVNEIINEEKQLNVEDKKRIWKKPFNRHELQESSPPRF